MPDRSASEWEEPRLFNLMFKTFMGPVEEDASVVYLRPETAQGSYVNFLNVQQTSRQRVPFGIAQLGKAFRNEITPGNFIFRTREFEQAEMQFFVKPGSDDEWFDYWLEQRLEWHHGIGIRPEKLRQHAHGPNELAHYAKTAVDLEYEFPFGWQELEGIHNRTDFDLSRHQEYSGKRLLYIDPGSGSATCRTWWRRRWGWGGRRWWRWSTRTAKRRSRGSRAWCWGSIRGWRRSRPRCFR